MDACYRKIDEYVPARGDMSSELDAWFAVSGDMDDFIYFGEDVKVHSEK